MVALSIVAAVRYHWARKREEEEERQEAAKEEAKKAEEKKGEGKGFVYKMLL